eukprot:3554903-Pleurochrysis_carterae.AAC.1
MKRDKEELGHQRIRSGEGERWRWEGRDGAEHRGSSAIARMVSSKLRSLHFKRTRPREQALWRATRHKRLIANLSRSFKLQFRRCLGKR